MQVESFCFHVELEGIRTGSSKARSSSKLCVDRTAGGCLGAASGKRSRQFSFQAAESGNPTPGARETKAAPEGAIFECGICELLSKNLG